MDYQNQRKYPRFILREYANIKNMNDETLCFGNISNISEDGICIICDIELDKGILYKLTFHLSCNNKPTFVSIMAIVIYQYNDSNGLRTGFRFDDDQQNIDKIKSWISHVDMD